MTGEPIFDSIIRHGRQDADGVRHIWGDIARHFTHHQDAAPAAQPGRQSEMSTLLEIWDTVKTDAENEAARAKRFAEEHLPVIDATVSALASNPLAQVAMSLLHLSPDFLSAVAAEIKAADDKLGAAKQAAADAQAAQDAALAAAAPPAEPAPVDPAADPNAAMA